MNPASIPNVAIPRSRFLQDFNHSLSMMHGDINVIDCFPVIPGDDFSVKKASAEIIMSTPIAPLFGNIKIKTVAMFVPMRLLWEHTEEFYGANKTAAGPQLTTYTIPQYSIYSTGIPVGSVSHQLGKPSVAQNSVKASGGFGKASVLKERAYWFIWSEWYRNQQLQDPFIMNKTDSGYVGSISGSSVHFDNLPAKVCKQYDMFTAATLSPQYGAAVELPLGSYAPLKVGTDYVLSGTNLAANTPIAVRFGSPAGLGGSPRLLATEPISGSATGNMFASATTDTGPTGSNNYINSTNLYADLSNATAAKINDIRYAFQLQKYLERANYGSRFFEVLAVHYGVTSPDSRLQRPEYLGAKSSPIVIRTVLSQAGYDAGSSQKVGQLGAASITMIDFSGLFSKGFVEPGYVFILASTSHERAYSQGLLREDTKKDRFEIYSPEFANLGDQAILNKEIMLTGDSTDDQVFGYQGHWDEYRYRKNRVSGILDPAVANSLDFWTLGDVYTTRPSLSSSFITENRDALSRCLVTGSNGPDYISDWYIQYIATREMPLYNIPGLVDHFGAL